MSIRNKLIVAFTVLLVLLLGVSGYSFYALNASKAAQQDMNVSWVPGMDQIHLVDKQLLEIRQQMMRHALVEDEVTKQNVETNLDTGITILEQQMSGYESTIITKADQELFDQATDQWTTFKNEYRGAHPHLERGRSSRGRHLYPGYGDTGRRRPLEHARSARQLEPR